VILKAASPKTDLGGGGLAGAMVPPNSKKKKKAVIIIIFLIPVPPFFYLTPSLHITFRMSLRRLIALSKKTLHKFLKKSFI
jgi:hypothetical protein